MSRIPRHTLLALFAASITVAAPASAITLEALGDCLANQNVTGATIITHGWQFAPYPGHGDSLMQLAEAIRDEADDGSTIGWLVDVDLPTQGSQSAVDEGMEGSKLPTDCNPGSPPDGHVVVLYDWAVEAPLPSFGWVEAAGDALFNLVNILQLADPENGMSVGLHFIGHSYGSAITSEAVERLAAYGVTVEHLTYLDAHDFDQDITFPANEDIVRLFEHGEPADVPEPGNRVSPDSYGATVWDNVDFSDSYFQVRGRNATDFDHQESVPRGRAVPGAANHFLSSELPADYDLPDLSGDHTWIWQCFYRDTVTNGLVLPLGCAGARTWPINSTGYYYSVVGGGSGSPPASVFFDMGAGYIYDPGDGPPKYSTSFVEDAIGTADQGELDARGLEKDDITFARWAPVWDRFEIANGDFSNPGNLPITDINPGWIHHGGGGKGDFVTEGDGYFLRLWDPIGPSSRVSRTHNRTYVPPDATHLIFWMRVVSLTSDDALRVSIGSTALPEIPIGDQLGWRLMSLDVPSEPPGVLGQVHTITFELVEVGGITEAVLDIDNVAFTDSALVPGLPLWGVLALATSLCAVGGLGVSRIGTRRVSNSI